jgi:hypothetical protein
VSSTSLQDACRRRQLKSAIRKNGQLLWARFRCRLAIAGAANPTHRHHRRHHEAQARRRAFSRYLRRHLRVHRFACSRRNAARSQPRLAEVANTREDGRQTVLGHALVCGDPALRNSCARSSSGRGRRFRVTRLRCAVLQAATFDISLHPIRNERGEVVLIVPECRDVTERKSTGRA